MRRGGKETDWGMLGEIHPQVLERFGISQPTAVFEVSLSAILREG